MVVLVTAVGTYAHDFLVPQDVMMVYLLGIVCIATFLGRVECVVASLLSVMAFDFFFVPPAYSFTVTDPHYIVTFAIMFFVGIMISRLARESAIARLEVEKERIRSTLLSAVSHDMRTPLTVMTATAATLADEAGGNELVRKRANKIAAEGAQLNRQIENLLDITRLDSGVALRLQHESTEELIISALSKMRSLLEPRTIHVAIEPKLGLVFVDAILFEKVIINLLENVATHTNINTEVLINAWQEDDKNIVDIADTGTGIREEDVTCIFQRWRRNETCTRGFGLGLSICKMVMEMHNGSIALSERDHYSTCFRLTLPISKDTKDISPPENQSFDIPPQQR